MKIDRLRFLSLLKLLTKAVSSKTDLLPGVDCIGFQQGRMLAFNGVLSITIDVEEMDIEGCVHASELVKLVDKMKDDELTLMQDDSGLIMRCGRSKPCLSWKTDTLLSYFEKRTPSTEYAELMEDFLPALSDVLIRGNKCEAAGVYVHDQYMIATNQATTTTFRKWSGGFEQDIWLSQSVVENILKCGVGFTLFATQSNTAGQISTVFLKSDDVEVGVNLLNTSMWIQRGLLASSIGGTVTNKDGTERQVQGKYAMADQSKLHGKIPDDFTETVERAAIMVSNDNNRPTIDLQFTPDRINIRSNNIHGDFSESIDLSYRMDIEDKIEDIYLLSSIVDTVKPGMVLRSICAERDGVKKYGLVVDGDNGFRACIQPMMG